MRFPAIGIERGCSRADPLSSAANLDTLPMKHLLSALALLACLSSCYSTLPSGERIGERVKEQTIIRLAFVDEAPERFYDRTLLVEATVAAVCQRAGCWMKIKDNGHTAMVRWEEGCGGEYQFPENAVGKRVVIQGSLYRKSISEEDAEHIEEEAGGDVTIERETHEINANAMIVCAY